MPSLLDIPGLGGMLQQRQLNQQTDLSQLQQMGALQGILAKVTAAQKEAAFRQRLSQENTLEGRTAVAEEFAGAEGLLKHADTRARTEQTKQIALQNLQQKLSTEMRHVYEFAQTLPLKERQTAIAEANAKASNLWKEGSLLIQKGNLDFNVGGDTSSISDVISKLRSSAAPVAPAIAPIVAPMGPQGALPANVPPSDAAAYAAAAAGGSGTVNRQMTLAEMAGMTMGGAPLPAEPPIPAPQPTPAPPNNLDARDLGAGARGPVMGTTPVPASVPAPAALPPLPTHDASGRPIAPKVLQQMERDRARPGMAGTGLLSPEALTFTAQQYLTGDRQAIQGYARSAPMRAAIQNAVVQEAMKQGITGPALAAKMADFAGIMAGSRSVGVRQAQIELASSEALKMIKIVEDTSAKFGRTNFVPWNMALKAFETGTGQPEVKAMGAAINSLINVYARAINPVGIPTIQDKEHARDLLAVIHSPEQVDAVLGILKQEMTAARASPADVREAMRQAIVNPNASKIGDASVDIKEFATEADAAKANLTPGTRVKIGGKTGTWK